MQLFLFHSKDLLVFIIHLTLSVSIFWYEFKCEHFLVLLNLQFKMVSYQHTNLGMNANESSRKNGDKNLIRNP